MITLNYLPKHTIRNSTWHIHYNLLRYLISSFKPKKIVELGTWYGFSYFSMCEIISQLKLDKEIGTKCYGVDHWEGDEHAGMIDAKEAYEFVNNINTEYKSFSQLIKNNFNDAKKNFEDRSIDFIHFDGRHFYEDIKEDFYNYLSKIDNNAIVLFHDTTVTKRNFGVKKFFKEISQNYKSINFKHGYGLGVLFLGDKAERIAENIESQNLEQIFLKLGKVSEFYIKQINPNETDIEDKNTVKYQKEKFKKLEQDYRNLEEIYFDLKKYSEELKKKISANLILRIQKKIQNLFHGSKTN